jgi:hypothetical protein
MMFIPTTFPSAAYDPIERDRVKSGRPATRLEVLQHQERAMRIDRLKMATESPEKTERPVLQLLPDTLDGIRRSLSRMLVHAGHRIGPEAA